MKTNQKSNYITRFWQMDPKNTARVLCLKTASALLLSVETLITAMLIDDMISMIGRLSDPGRLPGDVALLVLFWLLKRLILWMSGICWARLNRTAHEKLPVHLMEKKGRLSYLTMEKQEHQELMRRIGIDTAGKCCSYFENSLSLIETLVEVVGLLVLVAVRNVLVSALLLLIMVVYVIYSVRSGQESYEAYEESEELFRRADYDKEVMRDRKYVEERTLFQFGGFFQERWAGKFQEAIAVEKKANRAIFAKAALLNIFSTVVIGVLSGVLFLTVIRQQATVGFFISILKSFINFIDTVSSKFARRMRTYEKGALYLQDMNCLERLEEEAAEVKSEETIDSFNTIQSIEFCHVTFAYPGSGQNLFDDLSLRLSQNRQFALVGENGAGKSTLLKLLMGFYDDYTGEIRINGRDIRCIPKNRLRGLFAFVPQEIARYEVCLDEYLKSSDKNQIQDILCRLEMRDLDVQSGFPLLGKIEDDGRDLSGGQWQLLAIARAMMEERKINILDEPTAAIDPVREAKLYQLFQELMKDRFTLLVTHRLGAAKIADEIIVLKEGSVVERGSHDMLMEYNGVYQAMYNTQRKWYES
ncbi:MAG: ABC transporter ATP-binding protein [Lachnospiraceae bacterium]|nr:ABC transporter ATP-binding protein [Lachnospiraceae bacterium]